MNNLTFGDAQLQYYETIAGGAGAGPDFDGCDAVQTHMTNSRLTDPEILEAAVPGAGARVLRSAAARAAPAGTTAATAWCGGWSSVRRSPGRCSPITAASRPSGSRAARPARPARRSIRRADGTVRDAWAPRRASRSDAGDELTILTPGGGGLAISWARSSRQPDCVRTPSLVRAESRSRSPTPRGASRSPSGSPTPGARGSRRGDASPARCRTRPACWWQKPNSRLNLPSASVCGRLTRSSVMTKCVSSTAAPAKAPCAASDIEKRLDLYLRALPRSPVRCAPAAPSACPARCSRPRTAPDAAPTGTSSRRRRCRRRPACAG